MELLSTALRALRERNGFDASGVDDVVIGCVTQTGEQGACIARSAVLEADYPWTAAGVTLNRFCGSGLEAVNQAAARVASGFEDAIIAGGVESMSRVPMGSDGGAMLDVQTQWRTGFVPQGISADLIATLHGFDRAAVDAYALESQRRAAVAAAEGRFAKSLVPVLDPAGLPWLSVDEYPRPETTADTLAGLKPAFEVMGTQFGLDALVRRAWPQVERVRHVHTAGNSSGIVDGAAAVLVGSAAFGAHNGLRARARIRSIAVSGAEPLIMLTGPIPATEKLLKKAGVSVKDVDLFEVNEAFAVVPMLYQRHFDLSPEQINVNGGAIALGHPLGATGAMLLGTLIDELERRDLTLGLATLCIGGGMGVATLIERV